MDAILISIKLLLVIEATLIYSSNQRINEISTSITYLFYPLKIFKVNLDEINVTISLALNLIPIIKRELSDLKYACISKGIKINVKNMKYILSRYFYNMIVRVNSINEALISKGIG